MEIREHPEWIEKYPAIDGISSGKSGNEDYKRPIRSDIESLLSMPNKEFDIWYQERKEVTTDLLNKYETLGSIPALSYEFERHRGYNLEVFTHLRNHIEMLKRGLEYLEKIRIIRDEIKKD
jgi:hypothetical protein